MADELQSLLGRVDDPALRADLRAHIERIRAKRSFGLVFESHLPERVRLPEHPVRIGVKVAVRDETDSAAYEVLRVDGGKATIRKVRHPDGSLLSADDPDEAVDEQVAVEALVVIADFGEPVYPGLRRLGSVDRGGEKPAHVVIKGENQTVPGTTTSTTVPGNSTGGNSTGGNSGRSAIGATPRTATTTRTGPALPRTGTSFTAAVEAGLLGVVLGGAMLLVSRRRTAARSDETGFRS